MTKFEEKLEILPIKIIQHPVGDTKYYAAVHVKTLIAQADEEIADLKSQLQQQALPVVPDFVAEWYEKKKNKLEIAVYSINTSIDKKSFNDLTKIEKWFEGVENKPIETIFKMKDGYTVEKPQLFYLKHIDMSKLDETHDWFILHHGSLGHSPFCKGELPYYCNNAKFTQQEIDSMQTGSYEQIEVVK